MEKMEDLKYIEIKAPKSLNDLRMKHLKVLTDEKFQNNMNIEKAIEFVSVITGAKKNQLRQVYLKDLVDVYEHCLSLFNQFVSTSPASEIELAGKKFTLIDPEKVGVGWHIDISKSDLKNDVSRLPALMYIEKGSKYGEMDDNFNMIYPAKDRQKIFEEHMPLPVYLNLVDFFLRKSISSTGTYMGILRRKNLMIKKSKTNMNGNL